MHSIDLAHIRRLVFSVLFGSFCILALLAVLGGATRAASLDSPGTGLDPEIRYITMTSHLPLYDPTGGEGITKTVFFNNTTGNIITLTFEISGTPALTLTAGAAFGDAAQTYTSAETPWLQEVAYSVEAGGGDYPGVAYTVTNSEGQRATVAITYVRDIVGPYHFYLPIVSRNYYSLVNGDFEDEFRGWNTGRGPFSGHGSGLPQSVVVFNEGNRALLGEPGALDDAIHVGYGTIAQTFTVDEPYLQLKYWVFSYDVARSSQRYYDTFEVSVNRSPDQISNAERDTRGCASTVLNPEGTVAVSENGLVFCGGRPGTSGVGTPWDTKTWKTVTLDLSAFQGQNIALYLAIWSREYDSQFYNDRAWHNTWAYIDDIQLAE